MATRPRGRLSMRALVGLAVAVGFLTRVPMPSQAFRREGAQAASLAWYPLVGALIGAVLWALAWLLPSQPLLVAALIVAGWVALTGALHLDGVADSADAWVGGLGDRARTLEIMKDPRSGPAGVTAVVLVLLLKFAALASSPMPSLALVLAPALARMAAMAAFLSTPYVRSRGLGSGLVDAPRRACIAMLVAGAGACVLAGSAGAIALVCAVLVFALWRRACVRRLGGITGDTAGALIEIVETSVLVVLALR